MISDFNSPVQIFELDVTTNAYGLKDLSLQDNPMVLITLVLGCASSLIIGSLGTAVFWKLFRDQQSSYVETKLRALAGMSVSADSEHGELDEGMVAAESPELRTHFSLLFMVCYMTVKNLEVIS